MNWITNIVRPKIKGLMGKDRGSDTPDNLWRKCPSCGEMIFHRDLVANLNVCPQCGHHMRVGPAERFAGRTGPLKLLVVGGSLGARALNDIVPQALALLPEAQRPQVIHQSGQGVNGGQIEQLRANYQAAGVQAELTPFIDDTAAAFAEADVIVCRAGASTVTEIAAVGAAAVFVPFPHAVDDHQSTNARFLVDAGGGWLVQQADLTPRGLADMLLNMERSALLERALKAKNMQKTQATREVVSACEELA